MHQSELYFTARECSAVKQCAQISNLHTWDLVITAICSNSFKIFRFNIILIVSTFGYLIFLLEKLGFKNILQCPFIFFIIIMVDKV
jgi:hypothetical protein